MKAIIWKDEENEKVVYWPEYGLELCMYYLNVRLRSLTMALRGDAMNERCASRQAALDFYELQQRMIEERGDE